MVEFYKKNKWTTYAELNSTYKDLYDSVGATMVGRTLTVDGSSGTNSTYGFGSIRGGPSHKKAFFKSQVADRPVFGTANLKRMDNYIWVEDVVMEANSVKTPNLVMYKCKPNIVDFTGTGNVKLSQNSTRMPGHLTAISSHADRYISDEEKFTGQANKYQYEGKSEYIPIGRSIISLSKPYIEREDMYEYGRANVSRHGGQSIKNTGRGISYYSKNHTDYTEHGGATLDAGRRKVCFIKRHNDTLWKATKNEGGTTTLYFVDSQINSLIMGVKEHVLDSTNNYNNQITTENSFFDVVKHDKEVMMDGQDDTTNLIGTAVSRFSTKNTLKGNGQSMQMYCFWAGNSSIDDASSESNLTKRAEFYSPTNNPDPNRYMKSQETFVSYGPVPFPIPWSPPWLQNLYIDGSSEGTITSSTENTGGNAAGVIEIDVNLERLETAQCYSDTEEKISLVRRAFVVTMGFFKPSSGDTLMSYMGKHFTDEHTVDSVSDQWDGYEDADKRQINSYDDAAFPFLGYSFIKTAGIESLKSAGTGDFGLSGGAQEWVDGIHVIPLHGDNALLNTASGNTKFSGQGSYDVYVEADTGDNLNHDNPNPQDPLPQGSYMTLRWKFPAPGDPVSDNVFEFDICDPKTKKPLARASSSGESAAGANSEVDGSRHFTNSRMMHNYWWTGMHGNAGATSTPAAGLGFPYGSTDNGGPSYFKSDTSSSSSDEFGGGPEEQTAVWPRYLTLWLTNFANATDQSNEDMFLEHSDGEATITVADNDGVGTASDVIRRPTESSVYVDGIRFVGWNWSHSNATEAFGKYNANALQIPSPSFQDMMNGEFSITPNDGLGFPGYSAITFGTDEADDFQDTASTDVGIFLNDFQGNLANNQAVTNVRWGISTAYVADAYESTATFGTNCITNNGLDGGGSFFGNQMQFSHIGGLANDHSKSFTADTDISQTNAIGYQSGTGSVDGFTRAGYVQIKGSLQSACTGIGRNTSLSVNTTPIPTLQKRENILCSARILRTVDRGSGVYKVDNTDIFIGHEEDTFIAYLWGGKNRSTSAAVATTDTESGDGNVANATIKLIEIIDDKHVQLSWDGNSPTGEAMTTSHQLPYLLISPYKFWLYGVIQNWTYDAAIGGLLPLPAKQYSSAICTTGDATTNNHYGSAFGATYNEFLYNDAPSITGAYENRWYHAPEEENTILDIRDFGFGEYNIDNETGGFLAKVVPKTRQYNQFKMDNIFKTDSSLQPGDDIHFVLDSFNPNSKHEAVFYNNLESAPSGESLNSNQTSRLPYTLTVFEDDLPQMPKLSVKPYEADPYLAEFEIDAEDDDLWYGFIIVDSKPVNSQYHEAILHLPLNDAGSHGQHPDSPPANKAYKNNTDGSVTAETSGMSDSGQLHDIEGLAGNCMRFDGSNDRVIYNPASGNTLAQLTSEASWIVHFTPDDGSAGINKIIDSPQCDILLDADTGIVTAHVYSGASEYVSLTSPAITMDGETPCNAIVTFDKNLKAGNVKLYIDGKLVDQSGLTTGAGPGAGGYNWDFADDLHASTDDFSVGTSSLSFDGRIEEVVVYKKAIYPVAPSDKKFVLTKNLTEISGGSPVSYAARLFMKDYHNIRGGSTTDVATSPSVSYRKAAFRLVD